MLQTTVGWVAKDTRGVTIPFARSLLKPCPNAWVWGKLRFAVNELGQTTPLAPYGRIRNQLETMRRMLESEKPAAMRVWVFHTGV